MKQFVLAALLFLVSTTAQAQQVVKPIRHAWIVTSCEQWNCAAAALVLAGGDPHVIVLPTGVEDRPWLILRRVEEGSVLLPENEPFTCELFEDLTEASARFSVFESCHVPQVLTLPDGRTGVLSLRDCGKRRAVRR